MLARAGIAADHAYQSQAAWRLATVLRLLRLLLLLLLLMLHLTQQMGMAVPERGQVRRSGEREVGRHPSAKWHRAFLDRTGGVRVVAGRGSSRPQRAVTFRQAWRDHAALARVCNAEESLRLVIPVRGEMYTGEERVCNPRGFRKFTRGKDSISFRCGGLRNSARSLEIRIQFELSRDFSSVT